MSAGRPSKAWLLLFAFGDLAFNLYWQSIMLFLLFYYTDALELSIAVAATTFMLASVWDGIASFIAGVLIDQERLRGGQRMALVVGAIPLSLCFVLVYVPPLGKGAWGIVGIFAAQLLFRTAYAAVNVPYLAMSARVSPDAQDRAFVAGTRMLFGTCAAFAIGLGTVPVGAWLTGQRNAPQAFLASAMLFAGIGAVILLIVGITYREAVVAHAPRTHSLVAAMRSLARNRAFVSLNAAMMAMIVAITVLNKSVLYYFKYLLDDPEAGQLALASMGLISGVAVPAWMLLGRAFGLRTLWFVAAGAAIAGLALFALVDVTSTGVMQLFLVGMQAMIMGLNFVFWAMLPNTIEYGERTTGLHVEGVVFGLAALLQRIAIGIATAILGWSFQSAGYVANTAQSAGTLEAMRMTAALVPLAFLALSCGAMLLNPLGRGAHRRIVHELEAGGAV